MAEATTVIDPAAAGQGDEPSTSVSTVPTSGPMAVLYRITGGQSLRQVLPAAIGVVVALVAIIFFVVSQQPERTTLYASLPEAEKARAIDKLKNAGVDVALDPTTGDVIVPVRDYHSSRMTLAAQACRRFRTVMILLPISRWVQAVRLNRCIETDPRN